MSIPDEDVAKVRAATDFIALVGERTALKRVGRRYVGLCPFHSERSGSFSVNAEEGLYYCFGCQASGDAITFVRAIEGCDFVEAVERLAARAGITVRNDEDARAGIERGKRKQLYDTIAAAVDFYHERLLNGRDAGVARQYLRARGYDGETVRAFRIGFAPAGYDELVRRLRQPGKVLVEAGLAWDGRGRAQDAFRERIIFPILDPGGRPIALGGRVLPPELRSNERDPGPKYRNSPESPIYQKRKTLYGLNWAKNDMSHTNEAVVCEGYTDVIGFFRAGVPRAVATCGTALTEDHVRLLANFAKRIVLAFDADSAGQNAAARLYDWERLHSIELAVAQLPAGSDPGELARTDPAALAAAVADAQPFLGFQVNRALDAADLASPEGRSRAVHTAIAVVAAHPDDLVREDYLIQIADRTRHDPVKLRPLLDERRRVHLAGEAAGESSRALRAGSSEVSSAAGNGRSTGRSAARATKSDEPPPRDDDGYGDDDDAGPIDRGRSGVGRRAARSAGASKPSNRSGAAHQGPRAGVDALALAIHRPADVAPLFDEVIFTDPDQRLAFRALAMSSDLHEAIENAPPNAADMLRRIAVTDLASDADPEGTFIALVRLATESALVIVNGEARSAGLDGEQERFRTVAAVKEELELMREPDEASGGPVALDAARRLVAWLAQREGNGT